MNVVPTNTLRESACQRETVEPSKKYSYLDVGINNRDHLAPTSGNILEHLCGCGKFGRIPCKVPSNRVIRHISAEFEIASTPFSIRVLNVEPDDIHRNVEFVEFRVDERHISFIVVVPAALVIRKRE